MNAAVSVNEEVRKQNTTYSCKLDKMRRESEKLLERVYKNPLYSQNQRDEERKTVEQARMEVSAKFVSINSAAWFIEYFQWSKSNCC